MARNNASSTSGHGPASEPGETASDGGPSATDAREAAPSAKRSLPARGASFLGRKAAEKLFVGSSLGKALAEEAAQNTALTNSLITFGITKIGTRSVPGAVLVGTGLVLKSLYDRSEKRRKQGPYAQRKLDRQAAKKGQDRET